MADRFISDAGAYLPLLRLDRAAAGRALRFAGLGGRGAGRRAVAGWDEDPVTMAVESCRKLMHGAGCKSLIFASTSAPFFDRSQAGLVAAALGLATGVRTNDAAGSRRCGVAALLDALLGRGDTIVAAAEKRPAKAGSSQHALFGDGAAAVAVADQGVARLMGHASQSHDFLDFYASRELPTGYAYEERFVRETAARDIIVPTIVAACRSAGLEPSEITHAAVHEPLPGMWRDVAKASGLGAENHASALEAAAGDLGSAHPLFALALALDAASPGDRILVAGFGSGCDAFVLEVTGMAAHAGTAPAALREGVLLQDYVRFLSLTQTIDLDWGVRSEFEQKAQGTVLERYGRDTIGFVGGRDAAGNVQFPKSRIPVRPGADGPEAMTDTPLADCPARLKSVTADRLNYTPDPPFWFGLVQFDNGARVLMELTDAGPDGFAVDDPLAMRLRIKSRDRSRGSRTYFWKAAPASRPALES
jgi:hydroxymethylglutaryl-CoA synthase